MSHALFLCPLLTHLTSASRSDRPIGAFANARLHASFAADVGAYLLDAATALLPWMAARSAGARHKEARRLNASARLARTRFAFDTLFAHHAALRAGVVGVYAELVARSLRHLLSLSHSTDTGSAASGSVSSTAFVDQCAPAAVAHALIALWTSMHELPVLLWPACGAPVRAAFEEVCACFLLEYFCGKCSKILPRGCLFMNASVCRVVLEFGIYVFCLAVEHCWIVRPCIARGTPSGARRAPRPPFATRRSSLALWITRSTRRARGRRP